MQSLGKYRPFKTTAEDFLNENPIFSFYFYRYYLQALRSIHQGLMDVSQLSFIEKQMIEIQGQMQKIKSKVPNFNDQQSLQRMLEYTELMFAKNDHNFQNGEITKSVAQDFLTISRLYQVLGKLFKIDQDKNKRRIYAKKKFIDIMRQLKNQDKNIQQSQQQSQQSQQSKQARHSLPQQQPQYQPKQSQHPKNPSQQIQKINKKILQTGFKNNLPKPTKLISFDKIQIQLDANKALENAVSQLSFDRYTHAQKQTKRALQLLDQLLD